MDLTNKVAITGIGIQSAVGSNITEFTNALFHGKTNFQQYKIPPVSLPVIAAMLPSELPIPEKIYQLKPNNNEQRKNYLAKLTNRLPWHLRSTLSPVLEAWEQAGMNQDELQRDRIGIVVATQNSASHYQYDLRTNFDKQPEYLTPSYALNTMDSAHLALISDVFNIIGEGFTVSASSASGNLALIRGLQLIKDGYHDKCIVIGPAVDLSPMDIQGFINIGAMGGQHFLNNPHEACRPFDKASDGFIYGQASACMILESEKSAQQRHATILGYLLGGASVLDGNYFSDPWESGESRAMQKALDAAKINKDQINYINTHGTSSPLGDKVEIAAIESVFKDNLDNILINSTKSITGHCLWSAGIVEAIATIIQMQNGFVHPSLNISDAISQKCQIVTGQSKSVEIKKAISNSFGFGGINSSVVILKE